MSFDLSSKTFFYIIVYNPSCYIMFYLSEFVLLFCDLPSPEETKVAVMVASVVPMVKVVMEDEALLTLAPVPATVHPLNKEPVAAVAFTVTDAPSATQTGPVYSTPLTMKLPEPVPVLVK